ncbi:MAG: type II secretion system major pseudopilin GspG, partial [Gammaproteobacteria bacterium]|nr:type II secretion system major pseudopilin GspG [Gammaproteobacteria bacterium]
GDARIKTTKSQIKLIENALDLYKLDNFTYPTTEQGLEALVKKPSSSPEPKNYKSGGYLKGNNVPTDSWGNEFMYFLDKGQYEIVSLGADGQEGGEEENADISSLDH